MSSAQELWKMATRNVARNRRRSFITGGTIVLGVVAVLFSQGYITGLHHLIEQVVTESATGALQVQRAGYLASQELATLDLNLPAAPEWRTRLTAVPGVEAVAPRLRFLGMLSNGEESTTFMGTGVDPLSERIVCPRGPAGVGGPSHQDLEQLEGPGLQPNQEDGVVLGHGLAEGLKVKLGQTVTLLVQTRTGSMDAADVKVVGFFRSTEPAEDKHLVVVPIALAQKILHMPGRVTAYALRLTADAPLEETATKVRATLRGSEPPCEVHTWPTLAPYYRDVMVLERTVLDVVIGIIFVLVFGGVVNTMLMSVFERTREIGTLMSIGFRRRKILALFILESAVLALLAGTVGTVLGAAVVAYTHHRGIPFHIPAVGEILNRPQLHLTFMTWVLAGTLAGAIAGGLYPAYRASRLRPVEALHAT